MKKKKPEIRFNGFEEEWATTTLGECFLERVERSAEGELISVTISKVCLCNTNLQLYHKDPCPERGLNHSKVAIRKHRNDEKKENKQA